MAFHTLGCKLNFSETAEISRGFNRHGFKLVEKGICTGPITALVLLFQHAIVEAIPIGPIQYLFRVTLTWILHPLKYLDFLFGRTKWAEYLACNFFYLGRKPG